MSDKEIAKNIIDSLPDYKMVYVIDVLNGLKGLLVDDNDVEEVEPDEWDLSMIAEAEKVNDGTTISLEELASDLGLNV